MIDEKRFKLVDTKTGKEYEFDGIKGSIGPDVINISSLYKKTGLFTYDPGFTSTAACNSKITYVDGEKVFFNIEVILLRNLQIIALI